LRGEKQIVGFCLTTSIVEFTRQFSSSNEHCRFVSNLNRPIQDFVYLYQVVTLKEATRKGLGRQLIEAVLCYHKQSILANIVTSPLRNKSSLQFFKKMSFKTVGHLHVDHFRNYGALVSEVVSYIDQ